MRKPITWKRPLSRPCHGDDDNDLMFLVYLVKTKKILGASLITIKGPAHFYFKYDYIYDAIICMTVPYFCT